MTLKFSMVLLEVVEVRVRTKFHQAKCSGSWVINSALDFGQLFDFDREYLWNGSSNRQAENGVSHHDLLHVRWKQFCELWSANKKWPWPLKVNRVRAVVKVDVHAKYHQAECSGSWVIVLTEKKNSDENNTVRRYRADSNYVEMTTVKLSCWCSVVVM